MAWHSFLGILAFIFSFSNNPADTGPSAPKGLNPACEAVEEIVRSMDTSFADLKGPLKGKAWETKLQYPGAVARDQVLEDLRGHVYSVTLAKGLSIEGAKGVIRQCWSQLMFCDVVASSFTTYNRLERSIQMKRQNTSHHLITISEEKKEDGFTVKIEFIVGRPVDLSTDEP